MQANLFLLSRSYFLPNNYILIHLLYLNVTLKIIWLFFFAHSVLGYYEDT